MRAVGGKEGRTIDTFYKDRGNERDIRQVGAATIRVVHQHAITRLHVHVLNGMQHRHRHGTEVHGNMLSLGDRVPRAVKQGTRKVLALFDIGRKSRTTERHAHLFGDTAQEILKHFETDGIVVHGILPFSIPSPSGRGF